MKRSFLHSTLLSFFVFCIVIWTGCSKSYEYEIKSLEELEAFASTDNSVFVKTTEQGDFEFRLEYLPTELLLLSEYRYLEELKGRNASESAIKKQEEYIQRYREGYQDNLYFRLRISPTTGEDLIYAKMGQGFGSYSQWLQKLLFGIKEEIELVLPDGETVPLIHYQMDRNYGTSNSRTFMLAFPQQWNGREIQDNEYIRLRINEFGLGSGRVQFRYELPLPLIEYKETTPTTSQS